MPIRTAIMPMTTSSSTSVKAYSVSSGQVLRDMRNSVHARKVWRHGVTRRGAEMCVPRRPPPLARAIDYQPEECRRVRNCTEILRPAPRPRHVPLLRKSFAIQRRRRAITPTSLSNGGRNGTQFQLCRVDHGVLDPQPFPRVGHVNQPVRRLDHRRVGVLPGRLVSRTAAASHVWPSRETARFSGTRTFSTARMVVDQHMPPVAQRDGVGAGVAVGQRRSAPACSTSGPASFDHVSNSRPDLRAPDRLQPRRRVHEDARLDRLHVGVLLDEHARRPRPPAVACCARSRRASRTAATRCWSGRGCRRSRAAAPACS